MSRIDEDSFLNTVTAMAAGNIRALSVLDGLGRYLFGSPSTRLSAALCVVTLDKHQIYGPDIWTLYKSCNRNMKYFQLAIIQFAAGRFSPEEFQKLIKEEVSYTNDQWRELASKWCKESLENLLRGGKHGAESNQSKSH